MAGPEDVWNQYFGDEGEWQYFITDVRQRHAAVLMQDGEKFFWLKRMLSGTKCPYWTPSSHSCRKPLDPQTACYNTGFIGGYHQPLELYIALPSAARKTVAEEQGLLKTQPMRAWTLWTPRMADRDIVVRWSSGERFELEQVEETGKWRGHVMAQFFNLRPLQLGEHYGMNVAVPMVDR